VDVDAQTSISGSRSDADILAEVTESNVITTDEESDTEEPNENDIPLRKPSTNDVVAALNTLEELSVFMKFGNNLLHGLKDVNKAIELELLSSKKQANIEGLRFSGRPSIFALIQVQTIESRLYFTFPSSIIRYLPCIYRIRETSYYSIRSRIR